MKVLKLKRRDFAFCVFVAIVGAGVILLNLLPTVTQLIYR